MEQRLGPIGPSRSAHGQASLGFGSNDPRKKKKICPVFVTHCELCAHDIKNCCFKD